MKELKKHLILNPVYRSNRKSETKQLVWSRALSSLERLARELRLDTDWSELIFSARRKLIHHRSACMLMTLIGYYNGKRFLIHVLLLLVPG